MPFYSVINTGQCLDMYKLKHGENALTQHLFNMNCHNKGFHPSVIEAQKIELSIEKHPLHVVVPYILKEKCLMSPKRHIHRYSYPQIFMKTHLRRNTVRSTEKKAH